MNKAALDNRANQLNPNNPAYYGSRGLPIGSWPLANGMSAQLRTARVCAPVRTQQASQRAIALAQQAIARMYATLDERVAEAARQRQAFREGRSR